MTKRRIATAIFAVTALIAAVSPSVPVLAAQSDTTVPQNMAAVGINLHYNQGVSYSTAHPLIVSKLKSIGITVRQDRPLGLGWHSFSFQGQVSSALAAAAVSAVKSLNLASVVSPDLFMRSAAAMAGRLSATASATQLSKQPASGGLARARASATAATFKAANAPRLATISDAYDSTKPTVPQLVAKWSKPSSLYGATLVGYHLQTSFDAGTTITDLAGTLPITQTTQAFASGLTAGVPLWFRVASLTKLKGKTKLGAYSAWRSATPTTQPTEPTLTSVAQVSSSFQPTWNAYSATDAGGLPVTFTLVASAAGQPDVTCVTTTTTCKWTGLASGVTYSVKLSAANARGKSATVPGFAVADPLFSKQWALTSKYGINVQAAWEHTHGSPDVTVAVLDSGISAHPDLDGQVWRNTDGSVYGYNFVDKATDPSGTGCSANPTDPNSTNDWHGTHVSGIIAAANNNIGVVGVAPGVKLLEVRVMGSNGGSVSDLIAALNWAAGNAIPTSSACGVVPKNIHPAQVMNMSLGNQSGACDSATAAALQAVHDAGITVVSAAGNDASQAAYSYPGNCYPTLNIGASTYDGQIAYYSNYGNGVDIAAPGGSDKNLISTMPDGVDSEILSTVNEAGFSDSETLPVVPAGTPGYESLEGTSMAAPMVTGIVALLYSIDPTITPDNVWKALSTTGNFTPWPSVKSPIGNGRLSIDCSTEVTYTTYGCGLGIVNAGAAVDYVIKNP